MKTPNSVKATTVKAAEDWWDDLSSAERAKYDSSFKNQYSPTSAELITAYDKAHEAKTATAGKTGAKPGTKLGEKEPEPTTPEKAKGWWNSLSVNDRADIRDRSINAPPDDVLIKLYDDAHASAKEVEAEQQHTGDEPPTAQPATPYASATNADLMRNDAIPGENAALYENSPWPEGYQPPPPPEPAP